MEELIEELTKVRPEQLSKEGLKLFEKINEIIARNKELESALNNSVSKDELKELIDKIENSTEYNLVGTEWRDSDVVELLQELLNKGE